MSQDEKKTEAVTEAEGEKKKEELTEDQLEAVAGGVLIGLNLGHKELVGIHIESLSQKVIPVEAEAKFFKK